MIDAKEKIELDVTEDTPETIIEFFKHLLDLGIFRRAYDPNTKKLYEAAKVIHKHLCTLDTGYYSPTREVKLIEFASAYAKVHSGLRELG